MNEVFPVVSGVVIGVLTQRVVAPRLRLGVLLGLALVFGFIASAISGELSLSWAFIWVDTGLVLLAAGVTIVVMAAWRRRTTGMPMR